MSATRASPAGDDGTRRIELPTLAQTTNRGTGAVPSMPGIDDAAVVPPVAAWLLDHERFHQRYARAGILAADNRGVLARD